MKNLKQKLFSSMISLTVFISMIGSSGIQSVFANEDTVYGEEVTVKVNPNSTDEREINFNDDWKFYLGTNSSASNKNFDDSSWKIVNLPHDYSITQNFTTSGEAESGFLPGGTGWYRKSFVLPENYENKEIILNFDGIYDEAYVYVNDIQVGENHYGYNSFAFDITDQLICDGLTENVIAVKVVNTLPNSRWYSGSGIYRDVTLIATDAIHVERHGTQVTTPDIENGKGTVNIKVDITNNSAKDQEVIVRNTVFDASGSAVSSAVESTINVQSDETVMSESSTIVTNPSLWDIDNPVQYSVHTEVFVNGTLTDSYDTNFGFRYFGFLSNNGFYLNGRAVKLNGVCLHHDQGALGSASYYDAMYRQLTIMKDMGVNAIRTSHNPCDEQLIDICNELGLMVMEEAFDCWTIAKNGNSKDFARYFNTSIGKNAKLLGTTSTMKWYEAVMQEMITRDRNDPSVILWSLGNELDCSGNYATDYPIIAQNLVNQINNLDGTRPMTLGDNARGGNSTITKVDDIIISGGGIAGFNYASNSQYTNLHSRYGVMVGTETTSAVNSRSQYKGNSNATAVDDNYHLTSYDTSKVSWGMTAHESIWNTLTKDYVAGEFIWTGFDYIGEPTPWNGTGNGSVSGSGAIPNSSYFGPVDTAGFTKDNYYLYRSQWNHVSTTLHLVTAWDSDNMMTTNGKTPIVIYSNAPKVELYCNGNLIGTSIRTVNTTSAGHQYYTYTSTSNNADICTAVVGSNSTSLYTTFNVAYTSGNISAKAYDENGNEITKTVGNNVVTTPGTVSKLQMTANKEVINADDSSLVYITVDITDDKGVLDTTANNILNLSLSGDGEIIGVDNGDQATTEKYQQASVLANPKNAKIAAYAGKALVIVKSTKKAGSFTLTATSSGLTEDSVSVTTKSVSNESIDLNALASYSMIRDYTIKVGTSPLLKNDATGTLGNGKEIKGTITWDEITESMINNPGDYVISGTLSFEGYDIIGVNARLHVIADVIAMRNISTVTMVETLPILPDTVKGILADGTITGEFNVTWDDVTTSQFTNVGDIVTINGRATVLGEITLPVTCTVRVAKAVNTESTNAGLEATVSQDISSSYQSDNLGSINNGVIKPGDNTRERWTNYNNRTRSATAALTFNWDTAQLINSVNLYYYIDNCSNVPENIKFEYSLNGTDFKEIGFADKEIETYTLGAKHTYTFNQIINPVALRIIFTQKGGTTGSNCVGITEAEIMTYAGTVEFNTSADLSSIKVDDKEISSFNADILNYSVSGTNITANTQNNAGITILPVYEGIVRVITISEDGKNTKTYLVTLNECCEHINTEIHNQKAATCIEEGYTGDTYCSDCGELIEIGNVIPATGHSIIIQNQKTATCVEDGYTGDQYCTIENKIIASGTVISATGHNYDGGVITKAATCTETGIKTYTCTTCKEIQTEHIEALGHKWDEGVVTKEATETQNGIKTYTCSTCGQINTVEIPYERVVQNVEDSQLKILATQGSSSKKITLTGQFTDYENIDNYNIVEYGIIYMTTDRLGVKTLTVSTPGRTKLSFSSYKDDGTFSYTFTASSTTKKYAIRSYIVYTDKNGKKQYAYSTRINVSYNGLK